jgi:hypothetical protein
MGKLQIPARVARQDQELQMGGFLGDQFQHTRQTFGIRVHHWIVKDKNLPLLFRQNFRQS